jgi:hypothetical protein
MLLDIAICCNTQFLLSDVTTVDSGWSVQDDAIVPVACILLAYGKCYKQLLGQNRRI